MALGKDSSVNTSSGTTVLIALIFGSNLFADSSRNICVKLKRQMTWLTARVLKVSYYYHFSVVFNPAKLYGMSRGLKVVTLMRVRCSQEFDVIIKDKKDVEIVIADHLSRLENRGENENMKPIGDEFPDEEILQVEVEQVCTLMVNIPPWYTDYVNFLVCGIKSPRCSMSIR